MCMHVIFLYLMFKPLDFQHPSQKGKGSPHQPNRPLSIK